MSEEKMREAFEECVMSLLDTVEPLEPAPNNNLPSWGECKLLVDNSEYIANRIAEGGFGNDEGFPLATELHRFIYEYDDADPYRSAWFLHRLESLLAECRKEARKEVWLEAAEVCEAKADSHGWDYDLPSVGREAGAEFRHMAESDKTTMEGEK